MILKHLSFFIGITSIFTFAIYFNYTFAALQTTPEKPKKCQTVAECFNMVFSFPSNEAAVEVPKKAAAVSNKGVIPSPDTIPKDAIGYSSLVNKDPATEGQPGSLSSVAAGVSRSATGGKSCDDPSLKPNEGCQPSQEEVARRQQQVTELQKPPEKPEQPSTPTPPPKLPEIPKDEGGGKGGGEGEKGGDEGQKTAGAEEGGEVDKQSEPENFECSDPQDAKKCKRIAATRVIDKSGGTGVAQITCQEPFCSDGAPGTRYAEQAGSFIKSPHAGKYLVEYAKQVKDPKKGIIWRTEGEPQKIETAAFKANGDIVFVPSV